MQPTKILGHRGSKNAPENTLAAFKDAMDNGADGFEFDVQYTSDGVAVVIHDDTVDRTTNGQGRVDSFTLHALKQLTILGKDNRPLLGVTVPTLEEVMELADSYIRKRQDVIINIEIKDLRATLQVVEKVKEYVENKAWRYSNVIVSSFAHEALWQAKQLNSAVLLGILYEPEQASDMEAVVSDMDPYAVHPSSTELDSQEFLPLYCGKPLVVWIHKEKPYPANMPDIRKLLEVNPAIVITNYPAEVKAALY